MYSIKIIAPGKMESEFKLIFSEYQKRCKNQIVLSEFAIKEINPDKRIELESNFIIRQIQNTKSVFIVLLDIDGKLVTSEEFANIIIKPQNDSFKNLIFVIGGSYGVNQNVKNLAQLKISFGRNTWPHNLMKIMLIEQIFRAETILDGRGYHH